MLDAPFKVEFFGQFRVLRPERSISRFRTYKTGVLLSFLAFYSVRPHPREELIEMLWSECDPLLGRNSLSQSLSALRRQLEPPGISSGEVLIANRQSVQINPDAIFSEASGFESACERFLESQNEPDRIGAFVRISDIYRGDFLPGFYEDWCVRERERLGELYRSVLHERMNQLDEMNQISSSIEVGRQILEIDELDEETHLRLMNLYVADKRPNQALIQYNQLESTLYKELEVEPSAEATELAEQLRTLGLDPGSVATSPKAVAKKQRDSDFMSSRSTILVTALVLDKPGIVSDAESVSSVIDSHSGSRIDADSSLMASYFRNTREALGCAIAIQKQMDRTGQPGSLRMGLHLGELKNSEKGDRNAEVSKLLERTTLILASANPGQILCSETAGVVLLHGLEPDIELSELGNYRIKDTDRAERLYQADYKGRASQNFPRIDAEPGHKKNLPLQLSRFFGRNSELDKLSEWLDPQNSEMRLITITGPGGTGKTRLAIETAGRLSELYENAIWFAPLAAVTEPDLIAVSILESMRMEKSGAFDPFEYLATVLSRQKSCLVLDNFEQLQNEPAAGEINKSVEIVSLLLERVPELRCLVTSRKRLGLFGENEFVLDPLPVPLEQDTFIQIDSCESVRLFLDRARSVRPTFEITEKNANSIAKICRRLEGIPLALELAAAQTQLHTPSQILQKLAQRFDFLKDRKRQTEARHQQLRSTIDWSFNTLTPEVQKFFSSLAVFKGGGNLANVEAICDDPLALDHLSLLQDSSFLRVSEDASGTDMRFSLLETLREYGKEKLSDAELKKLNTSHAARYLEFAQNAATHLKGQEQAQWLQLLEQDHQNCLSAIEWSIEIHDAKTGLGLACALSDFWATRGHVIVGLKKLNEIWELNNNQDIPNELQALVYVSAGNLAIVNSDFEKASEHFERSLKLYKLLNDKSGQAEALSGMGRAAFERGDYDSARIADKASLNFRKETCNKYGIAASLNNLGLIASEQGDYKTAVEFYTESLELRREFGDKRGIATQLNNLGIVNRRLGDYESAGKAYAESLDIRRELKDMRNVASSLSNMSWLAENEMDFERSQSLQEECFAIRTDMSDEWGIALSHNIFGILARHRGDTKKAANHFRESLEIRRRLGNKLGIGETLFYLGDLYTSIRKFDLAQESLRESLELMLQLNNQLGLAEALEAYSRLAAARERYKKSTRLLFAACTIRKKTGARLTLSEESGDKKHRQLLKSSLPARDFQRSMKDGSTMSPSDAIELARQD